MRLLLDEDMPEEGVSLLRFLHHEADHIKLLGHQGAKDRQVVVIAEGYDVLITLDLHRQEEEWIAVHRAIVERGVRVLRLRLPEEATRDAVNLAIVRQLTHRMTEWMKAFQEGAALITISGEDSVLRVRSRDYVQELLEKRLKAR